MDVQQSSLTLSGVNVANYTFSGFSYNSTKSVATWTLSSPINSDKLSLDLHSTGANAAADYLGKPIDGEWTNGTSTYPSGNGVVGGDFGFAFNVLPADTNQDGIVNGQDIAQIASHWLATLPAGGAGGAAQAATFGGGRAAGASAASVANTSSPLGLPAPAFSGAPAVESVAALTGWPDETKVAAAVDDLFSKGTGRQSHALSPWARPAIMSLVKSQSVAGRSGTAGADVETETVTEQWISPIDDELLAMLAASRR